MQRGARLHVRLGCIQSQACHTDHCPTGVATQDPLRQRALVVLRQMRSASRNFHRKTLKALAEMVAAAGLDHPQRASPYHFMRRAGPDRIVSYQQIYRFLEPGEILAGTTHPSLKEAWEAASPESFAPQGASGPGNVMLAAE